MDDQQSFGFGETKVSDTVDMTIPLAARMRPQTFDEIIGQEHILGKGKPLRESLEKGTLTSLILWGPPGSGKTTIAEVIAGQTHANFARVSAVSSGVAELRRVIADAKKLKRATGKQTILFIDEIHRFNKAQQDAILPYVEDGSVFLIGATTENPSFEVNSALLSRSRLFVLHALSDEALVSILERAIKDTTRGLGMLSIHMEDEVLQQIAVFANGDARSALNILELAVQSTKSTNEKVTLTLKGIEDVMQSRALLYDKTGDEHYNLISALHKSLRGSDPDASLYWLARMVEAGEDPLYIVRRLIRFASEDIGMADAQALVICMAAQQAVHFVGIPEANLALAQAVVYLATAPKSNALYEAYQAVQEDVQTTRNDPVPLNLRNAPTKMMKDLDYGKDYKYAHDYYKEMEIDDPSRPPSTKLEAYLPSDLETKEYYHPTHAGNEESIRKWLEKRREKK